MIVYDAGNVEHGALLARWWAELHASGDINVLFPVRAQTLQSVFKLFEPPLIAMFDYDELGIWFMAWLSPTLDGAFFSLWVRKDRRHTPETYRNMRTAYDAALARFPVLLGVTIQERLLPHHELLGYTVCGPIPYIFDGKPAWIVVLTKDSFRSDALDQRV